MHQSKQPYFSQSTLKKVQTTTLLYTYRYAYINIKNFLANWSKIYKHETSRYRFSSFHSIKFKIYIINWSKICKMKNSRTYNNTKKHQAIMRAQTYCELEIVRQNSYCEGQQEMGGNRVQSLYKFGENEYMANEQTIISFKF